MNCLKTWLDRCNLQSTDQHTFTSVGPVGSVGWASEESMDSLDSFASRDSPDSESEKPRFQSACLPFHHFHTPLSAAKSRNNMQNHATSCHIMQHAFHACLRIPKSGWRTESLRKPGNCSEGRPYSQRKSYEVRDFPVALKYVTSQI